MDDGDTLHCSLLLYETNGASNSIRFNPRKGTQAHHCLLFCLRNASKY